MIFSKFFNHDPIEKLWNLLSSIKFLKNENIGLPTKGLCQGQNKEEVAW